jgi:hypothetical protein
MIIFIPEKHQYLSTENDSIDWISVTTLLSHFKKSFDQKTQASKSSRNKSSKWFGISPEEILAIWNDETIRALKLGTHYHNQQEIKICDQQFIIYGDKKLSVFKPIYDPEGNKIAPDQKLQEGIYPEHLVHLKSAGVCGQSDLVEVINGKVNITDYKTNKELKSEGYTNWEGITQKMQFPVSHLDDCNLKHYQLQLSIYLYIILKHNPRLKPGKIIIHHVIFENDGTNKFGYPLIRMDENGNPIVKKIVPYELTYLRDEVISIIQWLKENRNSLKTKKSFAS